MTISFSGLASGLDTSSWIESLTALKRAKVETFTAEKEKYVLNKETLNGIKSFFSSFRSMIEKVTDSRLGLGTGLDLFSQTKALTSNANILTAISTTDAKEGTYEVSVKNLATNTEATSGYKHTTTHTITETATMGSTLSSLGVKAGKIGVTVNGSERQVRLGNDETIQSFIKKLSNIGVNSDYDEGSGVFSIDLDTSAIRDIDNTGIVDALHLKNVNNTFTTNTLKTQVTNTVIQQVTGDTKLSELGVGEGNLILQHYSGYQPKSTISVDKATTFNYFVEKLNDSGYTASFSDGRITIKDAYIITDNIGAISALGLERTGASSSQASNQLTYSTTITEASVINSNTLLKDLNPDIAIDANSEVIFESKNGKITTVAISETTTVGQFIDNVNYATGLNVTLQDGIITFSNGVIRGGTYDIITAFGLTSSGVTSSTTSNQLYLVDKYTTTQLDATSTATITYTETRTAQLTDKLSDYADTDGVEVHIGRTNSSNASYFNLNECETFEDLFNKLHSFGIEASLSNGVISLDTSSGKYVASGLECFGITTSEQTVVQDSTTESIATNIATNTTTIGLAAESTEALKVTSITTQTTTAGLTVDGSTLYTTSLHTYTVGSLTEATTIGKAFGITNDLVYTINTDGTMYTNTISADATVGQFINQLYSSASVTATISDNTIVLKLKTTTANDTTLGPTPVSPGLGSATLLEQVQFSSDATGTTTLNIITTKCGTTSITTSKTGATLATTLGEINPEFTSGTMMLQSKNSLEGRYEHVVITFTSDQTIADVISALDSYGITATLDNTLTLSSLNSNGGISTAASFDAPTTILGGDGHLKITADGDYVITSADTRLQDTLGLTDKLGPEKSVTTTIENVQTEVIASENEGLFSLNNDAYGWEENLSVYNSSTGSIETITIDSSMTIANVVTLLEEKGINSSYDGTTGKFKIAASDSYIVSMGEKTASALKLSGSSFSSVKTETTTITTTTTNSGTVSNIIYSNTNSSILSSSTLRTATMDTTFADVSYSGATLSFALVNSSTGSKETVVVSRTATFADFANQLTDYNFSLTIENGIASLTSDGDWYFATSSKSNMANAFKFDLATETTTSNRYLTNSSEDLNRSIADWVDEYGYSYADHYNSPITVHVDGVEKTVTLDEFDSLQDFIDKIAECGVDVTVKNGRLNFSGKGEIYIEGLETIGVSSSPGAWNPVATYTSKSILQNTTSTSETEIANKDTKLSDLGITTGEYYLYKDGVKHTLYVSEGDTVGDFIDTLKSYGLSVGISDGKISWSYSGNAYFAEKSGGSNILEKLGTWNASTTTASYNYTGTPTLEKEETTLINATLDTKLSEIYDESFMSTSDKEGSLNVSFNGNNYTIELLANDTIQDLVNKFKDIGINATFDNGTIKLDAGAVELSIENDGTSDISIKNILNFAVSTASYSATDPDTPVMSQEIVVTSNNSAAANYADKNTKLSLLNISAGTLSVYRDGQKATINIAADDTFGSLEAKISSAFSDVKLSFNDGYLTIGSDNAEVVVGTATDTSNFVAITGIVADSNKNSTSARSLYKVNNSSKVIESGLFVGGNVTEGTFKVGNATIEITKDTTLNDIISQINYSDDSSATAYWDNINGNFVIKSKVTGASLINIEAGTSNFTDVMGFTKTDAGIKKMNIENQTLGQNAHFTINGTNFTSNSNTVTSDVSKINGVTLELKDITKEGTVTLTIEKDKDSIADAISNVVDSYNSLMENLDKELASTGKLNNETTLKFIKNQIRSLMTSSISNSGSFNNLSQIGISLSAATAGSIRTDNINTLNFDKDAFLTAFAKDSSSLKSLLIGTDSQTGILTQVENILDSALGSVTGYFASAEKSLNTKISNLNTKIEKTNAAADRYKSRLEAKFKSMDMLISKFQNQYSSFLS